MTDTPLTDRERILGHCSADGYSATARRFKVNKYYLWMIANNENYRPPRKVARKLGYCRYPRRARIAVSLKDAASAAKAIRKHGGVAYALQLAKMLEEET